MPIAICTTKETGIRDYRAAVGNLGVVVLRRERSGLVEVTTVSFWTSMDAVKGSRETSPGAGSLLPRR